MRPNGFVVLATLALVSPPLMTDAAAQVRRGGGGGAPAAAPAARLCARAARRGAAAAPCRGARAPYSAPAARFAAPAAMPRRSRRMSPLRRSTSPRFAAPHVATPYMIPAPQHPASDTRRLDTRRLANPRAPARMSPRRASTRRPHATQRWRRGTGGHRLNRNAVAPTTNRAGATVGNTDDRLRGRNAPTTVGQGPAQNAAAALQTTHRATAAITSCATPHSPIVLRDPAAARCRTARSAGASRSRRSRAVRPRRASSSSSFGFVLGFVGPVSGLRVDDFVDYTFWPQRIRHVPALVSTTC